MQFETFDAEGLIAPFIESIFHFKHFTPDHSIERVIPTGQIFLLFELDGMPRHIIDSETLQPDGTYRNAWIAGMHKHHMTISSHDDSEMFVVQFKAFGSFPFTHVRTDILNERIVPAEEIFGSPVLALREQLRQTESSAQIFQLASDWLTDRFDESLQPPAQLLAFIEQLQAEPASRFQELLNSYPGTQKSLIDQFKKYVGLTPKYYQRIIRFNDLLSRIHDDQRISWTDIAQDCGFSDQSHFIKEFRHFSGFCPTEFMRQEFDLDDPNFFPLDRKG